MTEIPTFVRLVVFPEVGTFIPHGTDGFLFLSTWSKIMPDKTSFLSACGSYYHTVNNFKFFSPYNWN